MRSRRTLYLALGIPAALVCFLYLTFLFVPNQALQGVVVRAAASSGYTLDCIGFGKAFPLGLKARGVELSGDKGALLKLSDVRINLKLLSLLTGRLQVGFAGRIGSGELGGDLTLRPVPGFSVQARGIRLEEIPFFATVAGARARGELKLNGAFRNPKSGAEGDLQLEVRAAELAGVKIGDMPLPDAAYQEVRGAVNVQKGRALLKSFTLNGNGIYVRLKGDLPVMNPLGSSPLNLVVEMMPKPEFLERQKFVFLLLTKYQTSPGAYSIPIHGTLAHPAL